MPNGWMSEVVVDGNLVSSRKPDNTPACNREMINVFGRQIRLAPIYPNHRHDCMLLDIGSQELTCG